MASIIESAYTQIGDFLNSFKDDEMRKELGVIIVTHILPDRHLLLNALAEISEIVAVIPKPKSIHYPTLEKLEAHYNFEFANREQIQNSDIIERLIRNSSKKKIILLDIGGYFAPILYDLSHKFRGRLIGVVEDTENGYQKYVQFSDKTNVPVLSVARSSLKSQEDYLVGQSIFYSTEAILREINMLPILHGQNVGKSRCLISTLWFVLKQHVMDLESLIWNWYYAIQMSL